MATTTSVQEGNFVGSSHVLETGDKIITDFGGSFGAWAMEVDEREYMGSEHEDWYVVKGDWEGAAVYNLWYSFETSKWKMATGSTVETVYVYKVE